MLLSYQNAGFPNRQFTRDASTTYFSSIFFAKYVPWQREVNKQISSLREMGFMDKFMNDPIPLEARDRWKAPQPPLEALQLEHFYLPGIVQFVGWLLAFTSLLVEFLLGKIAKGKMIPSI